MPLNKNTNYHPPPPPFQNFFLQHTCLEVISAMRPSFHAIYMSGSEACPPPPPTLKVVREWEGVGVWPDTTPPHVVQGSFLTKMLSITQGEP